MKTLNVTEQEYETILYCLQDELDAVDTIGVPEDIFVDDLINKEIYAEYLTELIRKLEREAY